VPTVDREVIHRGGDQRAPDAVRPAHGFTEAIPYARITAIMSGTTILQQGLTTTCKDPRISLVESDGRSLVGRMSP
jgi:hypothetical protein